MHSVSDFEKEHDKHGETERSQELRYARVELGEGGDRVGEKEAHLENKFYEHVHESSAKEFEKVEGGVGLLQFRHVKVHDEI
jgi:hypothetical protein